MAFSLTIQEGVESGRQYTFDQPEVSIGRTAENDVVLVDPGVSRKHAVIRRDRGRFLIQDQGSANGTQLNGNAVDEDELRSGDTLHLGPVVLAFQLAAASDRPAAEPVPRTKKPLARSDPRNLVEVKRPTMVRPVGSDPRRPAPVDSGPSRKKALAPPPGAAPALSASERARFLRENAGPLGRVKLALMEMPPVARKAVLGGGGLVGVALLLLLLNAIGSDGGPVAFGGDQSRSEFKITEKAKKDVVYGLGAQYGVTVQTRDELHFAFDYIESAIPQAYWVRFETKGVERSDEVEITVNGVSIGFAQGGMGDYTKEQRFRLPKKHLRPGVKNDIVFDNTLNPPGNEGWAIFKARLEIKALPVGTREELLQKATEKYRLALQRWEDRNVASENRFQCWVALRESMLFMEGIEPKPELYGLVQQTLREVDKDLEYTCNKILLAGKRAEEMNDLKRALAEYMNGLKWFPADDHHCRGRLVEAVYEYGGDPNAQPTIDGAPPPPN